jgi:hypothetical protein
MGFTANKNLEQVARGADVGTWDTPTNSNWGIVDNSLGGVATIPLTNAPVVLSPSQYQCAFITFTGALTGNVTITMPAVGSFYTIQNLTSNTSAFQVTLTTGGGQYIGAPWGEPCDIFTDGTNVKFRSLAHHVGDYWDFGGSSVPAWVSACSIPPYLNCDGTSFSSATYPILTTIFKGVPTLPDSKGRARFTLNQGTGRITTTGGLDGDTLLAGGGSQTTTLSSQHLPNVNFNITDPGHTHTQIGANVLSGTGFGAGAADGSTTLTGSAVTGITVNSGGSGLGVPTINPGYIGGITMIRAA